MTGTKTFSWDRYWAPKPAVIRLEQFGGYLCDPEESFGRHANPTVRRTDEIIEGRPGLTVLCGEPAMGKTFTLDALLNRLRKTGAPPIIGLTFREIPDRETFVERVFNSDGWKQWLAGDGRLTLVIDGVDEGTQKIAGFVAYLAGVLRGKPLDRLQLILVCRSVEWPDLEGKSLAGIWPTPQTDYAFELCPLRRTDVELAAKESGFDAKEFLRALSAAQVESLAKRPMTLQMLLRQYQSGAGFPTGHRQLYLTHCRTLCDEEDPDRPARLAKSEAGDVNYRVAQRIAALLLLCNRSAVFIGRAIDASPKSDLTIDEIISNATHTQSGTAPITREQVLSALKTPLFWPQKENRVHFFHQTFAECLACEYLCHVPLDRLRPLLLSRDPYGEYVQPQLAELTAWLTGVVPDLFQLVLGVDPEILLRSDASSKTDAEKAAIVEAVLAKAADEKLFDDRDERRFYGSLRHPGLAALLRRYIGDRSMNTVVRRMAIRIGECCGCSELLDDLFKCLHDPLDAALHRFAAAGLDEIATRSTAKRLLPFATGKKTLPGGTYTRFWCVYALLRQGYWTLTDAAPYLDYCLGPQYLSNGYLLAQWARPSDAEALLERMLTWPVDCFDSLSPYYKFAEAGIQLALTRLGEAPVRRLLAKVWLRVRRAHDDLPSEKGRPTLHSTLAQDPNPRRAFVGEVIELLNHDDRDLSCVTSLLKPDEDLPWLIELLSATRTEARRRAARVIFQIYDPQKHWKHLDAVLARFQGMPEVAEEIHWLRPSVLADPETMEVKAAYHRGQAFEAEKSGRRTVAPSPIPLWRDALAQANGPAREAWMRISRHFYKTDKSDEANAAEKHDITTSPGWRHSSETERDTVRAAAKRFLLEVPGDSHLRQGDITDFGIDCYRAVFLCLSEIEKGEALRRAVKRNWLPTLLFHWFEIKNGLPATVAMAHRLSPAAGRKCFQDILRRRLENRSDTYTMSIEAFGDCWSGVFERLLFHYARDNRIRSDFGFEIRHFLDEVAPQRALDFALLQVTSRRNSLRERIDAGCFLFEHGIPNWTAFWPVLRKNARLAKGVFLAAGSNSRLKADWTKRENDLLSLYQLARRLFPPSKDPPTPEGSYSPTPEMNAARLRDGFLHRLSELGTLDACRNLESVAAKVSQDERLGIRWILHAGIVAMRRRAWSGVRIDDVVSAMTVPFVAASVGRAAIAGSPSIEVKPLRFDELPGNSFERMTYDFEVASGGWKTVEWIGQSGGDGGNDIRCVSHTNEVTVILCANYRRLTKGKAFSDLTKIAKSEKSLNGVRVLGGGKISATLRQRIKGKAAALGIGACEVRSGPEYEAHLRAKTPDIVERYFNGVVWPRKGTAICAGPSTADEEPLSSSAVQLLLAMVTADDGVLLKTDSHDGYCLTVNGAEIQPDTKVRRLVAKWEAAIEELCDRDCILSESDVRFTVTQQGHSVAEALSSTHMPAASALLAG